jgi:hypothetical protein
LRKTEGLTGKQKEIAAQVVGLTAAKWGSDPEVL